MLRDIVEIATGYIQYLLLLIQISPSSFPDFYTRPFDILKYINLDLLNVFDESSRYKNSLNVRIPTWVPLDFRLQFIVVSVLGPLFISIAGMFFLGTKIFFVWFMLLLAGTFVLIFSVLSTIDQSLVRETILPTSTVQIALYCGVGVTATVVISGGAVMLWNFLTKEEREIQEKAELAAAVEVEANNDMPAAIAIEDNASSGGDKDGGDESALTRNQRLDHIMLLETAEVDIVGSITRAAYFSIFFAVGLVFARVIRLSLFEPIQNNDIFYALSGVIFFFAALFLIWFLLGLFRAGRELQFNIGVWVRDNFVSILLLLISLVYTPAVTNIISVFSCEPVTCFEGYHLPIAMAAMNNPQLAYYSDVKGSTACFACNFTGYNQTCPSALQRQLCGLNKTESRLTSDVTVPCDSVGLFFYTASAIMLASFVVTMPLLYFILTNRSTKMVESEFPLDARQVEGYTEDEKYDEKVHLSDNVAKFIYDPFSRRYKHWRLLSIGQKLVIVVISVMARGGGSSPLLRSGSMGVGLSLGIHLIYFVYVSWVRPFNQKAENLLMGSTQAMLCIVSLLGLLDSFGLEPPYEVMVMVAVFIFAAPFLALVTGEILTFKDDVLKDKAREERVRLAQQKAEDADGEQAAMVRRLSGGTLSLTASDLDKTTTTDAIHAKGQHSPLSGGGATVETSDSSTPNSPSSPHSTKKKGSVAINVPDLFDTNEHSTGSGQSDFSGLGPSSSPLKKSTKSRLANNKQAIKALFRHPRPKMETPSQTLTKSFEITGNMNPAARYAKLPKPSEQDVIGRPTLVSTLRRRSSGFTGGLFKKGSIDAAAKGPGGAMGAAWLHLRNVVTARKNTAEESARARDNWALAKLAVMAHVRDEKEKLNKNTQRGRQKSFFVGGGAASTKFGQKAGKKWDNFLAQLLQDETKQSDTAMETSVRKASNATHTSNANDASPGSAASPALSVKSLATAAPAVETLQFGFDPFQRAKEKKRLKEEKEREEQQKNQTEGTPFSAFGRVGSFCSKDAVADPEDNFASIQGGAAGRRQHILLRLKLQQIYDTQMKRLQLTQQAVDFRVNKDTISKLNNFFVFLGLFALVGFAFGVIGAISKADLNFYTGVLMNDHPVTSEEFAGYGSWANFTSHCCCVASVDQTPSWPYYIVDVEEWLCENGAVKERVRRAFVNGILRNGYDVRSMCGMTFADCQPAVAIVSGGERIVNISGCSNASRPSAYDLMLW